MQDSEDAECGLASCVSRRQTKLPDRVPSIYPDTLLVCLERDVDGLVVECWNTYTLSGEGDIAAVQCDINGLSRMTLGSRVNLATLSSCVHRVYRLAKQMSPE